MVDPAVNTVQWPTFEQARVALLKPANGKMLMAVFFARNGGVAASRDVVDHLEKRGYRRYGQSDAWVISAERALQLAPDLKSPSSAMLRPVFSAPGVKPVRMKFDEWRERHVVLPNPAPAPIEATPASVAPAAPVYEALSLDLALFPDVGRMKDGALALREGGAWRPADLDQGMDRVAALVVRNAEDARRIVEASIAGMGRAERPIELADFEAVATIFDVAVQREGAYAAGMAAAVRRRFDLTKPESLLAQAERFLREAPALSLFLTTHGQPSVEAMLFLERLSGGLVESVSQDPLFAVFRGENVAPREGVVPTQALDIVDVGADAVRVFQRVEDELRARAERGCSLFVLDAGLDDEALKRILEHVGREYGVESAVRFTSPGFERIMLAVGRRRPSVEMVAPDASLRIGRVANVVEAFEAAGTALVARRKIAAFLDDAEKADEPRQQPYRALSAVGKPSTMIPVALMAAQQKALENLREFMEPHGGLDAWLAGALDIDVDDLDLYFSPEQVDAVGLAWKSVVNGRAFLNEDATGIGKGRAMAATAALWARAGENNTVLYLTESGEINAPDVLRDISDTGRLGDFNIVVAANHCAPGAVPIGSMDREARDAMFASGGFGGANLAIMTYSQFNREESAAAIWAREAVGANTLVILDESHNALNADANTGKNIQDILERAGARVFASATPLRPNSSFGLYGNLLPARHREKIEGLGNFSLEVQEVLSTMLVEDGVAIRRDHDLSNLTIRQDLPDPERGAWLEEQITALQPVIRAILSISAATRDRMGEINDQMRDEMRRDRDWRRLDRDARLRADRQIDARLRKLNGNAQVFGPLEQIVGGYMTAIKLTPPRPGADGPMAKSQALLAIEDVIGRGRKPIVSLKMTGESLLSEWRAANEEAEGVKTPTFRDLALRAINRLFVRKIDGQMIDMRVAPEGADANALASAADFQNLWRAAQDAVQGIREDIPVSPIDALMDQMAGIGVKASEVTGRSLYLRADGAIERRANRAKRDAIDQFNDGSVDAIVINAAGSTGGSMHASPLFKDQRPRTKVELELDTDIVKHIQGIGRGNRYGQLHGLEIVTLLTGALPEIRRASIANSKLAKLGAVVEANRDHPLRDASTPDMVNAVGDRVAFSWLTRNPAVVAMLEIDLPKIEETDDPSYMPAEAMQKIVGLMNRLLSRMIVIDAVERERIFTALNEEFVNMVDELDSRNENPLRPRRLDGRVEIGTSELFSGAERGAASAFDSPVYLSNAVLKTSARAIDGRTALRLIEEAARKDRGAGRAAAERLRAIRDDEVRIHLGRDEAPTFDIIEQNPVAKRVATRLDRYVEMLETLTPGRVIMTTDENTGEIRQGVVVTSRPASGFNLLSGLCHSVTVVWPGSSQPEKFNFSRLLYDKNFSVGDSIFDFDDMTEFHAAFSRHAGAEEQRRAMVLTGNLFDAEAFAKKNGLGAATIFQDERGEWRRGVVVTNGEKLLSLRAAPVHVDGHDGAAYFARAIVNYALPKHYVDGQCNYAALKKSVFPNEMFRTLLAPFGKDKDSLESVVMNVAIGRIKPGSPLVADAVSVADAVHAGQNEAAVLFGFKFPAFSARNASFWRTPAGEALWPFVKGSKGEMPEKPDGRNFKIPEVSIRIPLSAFRVSPGTPRHAGIEEMVDTADPAVATAMRVVHAAIAKVAENDEPLRFVGLNQTDRTNLREFIGDRIAHAGRRDAQAQVGASVAMSAADFARRAAAGNAVDHARRAGGSELQIAG